MAISETGAIDAIGIDKATGAVVLTIFDALDWEDEREHLLTLQAKLNAYFSFFQGGQIYEDYPEANGRAVVIDIVQRVAAPPAFDKLVAAANNAAAPVGLSITSRVFAGKSPSPPA